MMGTGTCDVAGLREEWAPRAAAVVVVVVTGREEEEEVVLGTVAITGRVACLVRFFAGPLAWSAGLFSQSGCRLSNVR